MEKVKKRLIELLYEMREEGKGDREITGETDIIKDLGFDSLSIFELLDRITDEWGVDLLEEEDVMSLYQKVNLLAERIWKLQKNMEGDRSFID